MNEELRGQVKVDTVIGIVKDWKIVDKRDLPVAHDLPKRAYMSTGTFEFIELTFNGVTPMTFHSIKNPPQWLLDGLLKEATTEDPCPDCAATVSAEHSVNCDVARCLNTGAQRLCCDCGDCGSETWDGKWPNTDKAYQQKLVCFDDISGKIMFDYNRVRWK